MKRLFIGSLLTLGVIVAISSCNNGAYDANPKTDLQGALNPLADTTGKGAVVYIGTMRGLIDGGEVVFSPAYYSIDPESGTRHVWARALNDSVYWRTITMSVNNDYLGTVDNNDTVKAASFTYSVYDTVRRVHKKYTIAPADNKEFNIILYSKQNNTMRGYFDGTIKNTEPILPPPNPNDIVTFKQLNFYLDSKPFKK